MLIRMVSSKKFRWSTHSIISTWNLCLPNSIFLKKIMRCGTVTLKKPTKWRRSNLSKSYIADLKTLILGLVHIRRTYSLWKLIKSKKILNGHRLYNSSHRKDLEVCRFQNAALIIMQNFGTQFLVKILLALVNYRCWICQATTLALMVPSCLQVLLSITIQLSS